MDLSKIASSNGILELLYPGKTDPVGLRFEILPPDHEKLKQYMRKTRDKHRHLAARGRGVQTTDEEKIAKDLAMTAVVGWEWTKDKDGKYIGSINGENPEFSVAVLNDLVNIDWIRIQIDQFLADDKNFFQV